MRFVFVTGSGRESPENPHLQALLKNGVKDLLCSYFFLTERNAKEDPLLMYARLRPCE